MHDSNIPQGLHTEEFTDSQSAKRFLRNLNLSSNYWHRLTTRIAGVSPAQSRQSVDISQLLTNGKLKVFDVTSLYLDKTNQKPESSTLKKNNSHERYRFEPSLSMLTNHSANTKQFHKQEDAEAFIKELAPDQAQLAKIINHVNAPNSPPPIGKLDDLIASLSQSIVEGGAIISVENNASSLPKEELLDAAGLPGNRKAGLGPQPDDTPAPEQKLISVSWNIADAMCGEDVVLNGSAINFPANTSANAEIIKANNVIQVAQIQGQDTFTLPWKVRDVVFVGNAMPNTFELDAKLSALGQTVKAAAPLTIKRVPDAPEEPISFQLTSGRFSWTAAFRIAIEKNLLHVKQTIQAKKAWLGKWISFDSVLNNRDDWAFVKKEGVTWKFWDKSSAPHQWADLPRDVGNYRLNPLVFIKSGASFVDRNEPRRIWPEAFVEPTNYDNKKQAWLNNIHAVWDNQFILKHKGCVSADTQCCAWDIRVHVNWSDNIGDKTIYIIWAEEWERSNAQDWYLSENGCCRT